MKTNFPLTCTKSAQIFNRGSHGNLFSTMTKRKDPFAHHLRLAKPCGNCPFLKQGAIELEPGRTDGIIESLLKDDQSTFQCHKTVHSSKGGTFKEGSYTPSGHEAMCAGAAAVLMKRGRPTVNMRISFALGVASPSKWDAAKDMVVD